MICIFMESKGKSYWTLVQYKVISLDLAEISARGLSNVNRWSKSLFMVSVASPCIFALILVDF